MNEKLKTILLSGLSLIVAVLLVIVCATPINVPQRQVYAENRIQNELVLDSVTPVQYNFAGSNVVLPYTDKWIATGDYANKLGSQIWLKCNFGINSSPYFYLSEVYIPYVYNGFTIWLEVTNPYFIWNNTHYDYFDPTTNQYVASDNSRSVVVASGTTFKIAGTVLEFHIGTVSLGNCFFQWDTSNSVTYNFQGCSLGSGTWNGTTSKNYVEYFAENGYYFRLNFYNFSQESTYFTPRTYFFGLSSEGYAEGKRDGETIGFNKGEQYAVENYKPTWYDEGFRAGKREGESIGYNNGLNDANQYTFLNLFGALFDAPIQAFTGLLNFQIFGIDARSLVLSLFTLSIILVIIRMATKGGGN